MSGSSKSAEIADLGNRILFRFKKLLCELASSSVYELNGSKTGCLSKVSAEVIARETCSLRNLVKRKITPEILLNIVYRILDLFKSLALDVYLGVFCHLFQLLFGYDYCVDDW